MEAGGFLVDATLTETEKSLLVAYVGSHVLALPDATLAELYPEFVLPATVRDEIVDSPWGAPGMRLNDFSCFLHALISLKGEQASKAFGRLTTPSYWLLHTNYGKAQQSILSSVIMRKSEGKFDFDSFHFWSTTFARTVINGAFEASGNSEAVYNFTAKNMSLVRHLYLFMMLSQDGFLTSTSILGNSQEKMIEETVTTTVEGLRELLLAEPSIEVKL